MGSQIENLLSEHKRKLLKSIAHLEFSYQKVQNLSCDTTKLKEENLETWESFSSRFSRTADIFLSKYLRTVLKIQDPAYNGTLIDSLNIAEKQGLIQNAQLWYKIRELRNIEAHEYTEESLSKFFETARQLAPIIIALKSIL